MKIDILGVRNYEKIIKNPSNFNILFKHAQNSSFKLTKLQNLSSDTDNQP